MAQEFDPTNALVKQLEYIWKEYQYRHDLCWRAVYKVSFAVLFLTAIPYVRLELAKVLAWWNLFPAVIAIGLAGFGINLLNNELEVLAKIKVAYHHLQDRLWDLAIENEAVKEEAKYGLQTEGVWDSRFYRYVRFYLIALLVLSIGDFLFLACLWIPHLNKLP